MKRFAGFLMITLVAALLLFCAIAHADILTPNIMDSTVKLATGSSVIFTVNCYDLEGTNFENYLIDLKYDPSILGSPKVVDSSYPEGWTIYKGLFSKGRITYFAADETTQNPSDEDFSLDIEFKVIGIAAEDTPFETTLKVSGTALVNGDYVNQTSEDSVEMILKGGVPIGTIFTESGKGKYIVTGKSTVAFYKADTKATSLTIPATIKKAGLTFKVTEISDKAFYKQTKIKTVTIGSNVTKIGGQAFAYATRLATVKGNAGAVTIGKSAFKGCKALKSFAFGKSLKTIEASAFEGCVKLPKAVLYSKVEFVGARAFYNCKAMKTLEIRTVNLSDISTIGKNAFTGTPKTMKVTIYVSKASIYNATRKALIKRGVNSKATFRQVK